MLSYVVGRLGALIVVLLGTSVLIFGTVRLLPGDPVTYLVSEVASEEYVAERRRELGLDQPVIAQYGIWVGHLVQGDLGRSVTDRRPVAEHILSRLPATATLMLGGIVVAGVLGATAGVISAARPYSAFDRLSMLIALIGTAVPTFFVGPLLMLIFAVHFDVLPAAGMGSVQHLVLPALTVGLASAGLIARLTRSAMLEALSQDFIQTARAKGLAEHEVHLRHAFRNALLPVVTILGLQVGFLMSGTIIVETIFAWPGIGQLIVDSIHRRDYPLIQGTLVVYAGLFALVNLGTDLIYGFVDPRIRFGKA